MSRALVMEGSLAEFDLVSVLQTVSIGRQYTAIELEDERGDVVGTMAVKAGQVLAASAPGANGIAAVRRLVRARSHRFRVYRERGGDVSMHIGSVPDVLMEAIAEEDAGEPEAVLMEGSLRQFDLSQLLEAVSLGRQCIGIDLYDERGRRRGAVCVKGGQILLAEHGQRKGAHALGELLEGMRDGRFVVFKTTSPAHVSPLFSVADLADPERREALGVVPTEGGGERPSQTSAILPLGDKEPSSAHAEDEQHAQQASRATTGGGSREGRHGAPTRPMPFQLLSPSEPDASRRTTLPAIKTLRVVATPEPREVVALPRPHEVIDAPPRDDVGHAPDAPLFRHGGGASPSETYAGAGTFLARTGDDEAHGASTRVRPVICVTGPKGGSGQTTVTLNLAVALARRDLRVALLDANTDGLLVALDASRGESAGLGDVLAGRARLEDVCLSTRVPGLSLYPSGASSLVSASTEQWSALFETLREGADMVLVDCPAALEGCAPAVLGAATHTLIVLAAEPSSLRALGRHEAALARLPGPAARLLGLVLNQLDYQARASLRVLEELCTGPQGRWIFDVPIPRSPAFLEATSRGVPIAHESSSARPTIGWVFELLASSVLERLGLLAPCLAATPLL